MVILSILCLLFLLVGAKDRLSVVTYDTNVYLDFGLKNMNKDNKYDALQKIQNISDGSDTNLCEGLMKGLCQIIDRPAEKKNEVAYVLLFTDGLANEGIYDFVFDKFREGERERESKYQAD